MLQAMEKLQRERDGLKFELSQYQRLLAMSTEREDKLRAKNKKLESALSKYKTILKSYEN